MNIRRKRTVTKKTKEQKTPGEDTRFNYLLDIIPFEFPKETIPFSGRNKKEQDEDPIFFRGQQEICKLIGYLPTIENKTPVAGQFMPGAERKRQLEGASEKKKKQLMAKWGISEEQSKEEVRQYKWQLKSGQLVLPFIRPLPIITQRGRKLAIQAAQQHKEAKEVTEEDKIKEEKKEEEDDSASDTEGGVNKAKRRKMLIKREEAKNTVDVAKLARKRKEAMDRIAKEKKENRQAMLDSAMPDITRKQDAPTQQQDTIGDEAKAAKFIFNLQSEETKPKAKKHRPTIPELKQELMRQIANRKMLSKLQEDGDIEEFERLKSEREFEEASKRIEGEKVDDYYSVGNELRKAEKKKKNSGKKVKELLERQKQDKHKRLVKKSSNVRERRVDKLSSKMNKLKKKGHIVPQFM